MKIYNTKNCLSKGIQEYEIISQTDSGRLHLSNGHYIDPDLMDWHRSKETAIARAEYLRDSHIKMLQNQIEKAKAIIFV